MSIEGTYWRNKHTGVSAQITKVHIVEGLPDPVFELTYDMPQHPEETNVQRWNRQLLLKHWKQVKDSEEEDGEE